MTKFLNRLLGAHVDMQSKIFSLFCSLLVRALCTAIDERTATCAAAYAICVHTQAGQDVAGRWF